MLDVVLGIMDRVMNETDQDPHSSEIFENEVYLALFSKDPPGRWGPFLET